MLNDKSRMKGDFQVRFCERLGLKCPCLLDQVPGKADDLLHTVFDVLLSITRGPTTLDNAIKNTSSNLERTAFEVGNLLAFRMLS